MGHRIRVGVAPTVAVDGSHIYISHPSLLGIAPTDVMQSSLASTVALGGSHLSHPSRLGGAPTQLVPSSGSLASTVALGGSHISHASRLGVAPTIRPPYVPSRSIPATSVVPFNSVAPTEPARTQVVRRSNSSGSISGPAPTWQVEEVYSDRNSSSGSVN